MFAFNRAILLLASSFCLVSVAKGAQFIDVPIIITADERDVCGVGEIIRLDPKGDGFLSVRSGPGGRPYRELDHLYNGNQIYICDFKGKWFGVVYSGQRGLSQQCGLSKAWRTSPFYTGPCRYGWVHRDYVRVLAE